MCDGEEWCTYCADGESFNDVYTNTRPLFEGNIFAASVCSSVSRVQAFGRKTSLRLSPAPLYAAELIVLFDLKCVNTSGIL